MNHFPDIGKMISETPRTDAGMEYDDTTVDDTKEFARQLERELNAANDRIKRLEEAGKNLRECASWLGYAASQYGNNIIRAEAAIEAWDKEAKP